MQLKVVGHVDVSPRLLKVCLGDLAPRQSDRVAERLGTEQGGAGHGRAPGREEAGQVVLLRAVPGNVGRMVLGSDLRQELLRPRNSCSEGTSLSICSKVS